MKTGEPNFAVGAPFQEVWERFLHEQLKPEPPNILYHYTNVDGLLGIVRTNRLKASDVLFMNDSTEIEYGRKLVVEEAVNAAARTPSPLAQGLFKSIDKILYAVDGLIGTFFAACFCEDDDLLSQWRGYSSGPSGYALGFRVNELGSRSGNRSPEQGFLRRRVIYDPEGQRSLVAGFLDDLAHVIEGLTAGPLAAYEQDIRQTAESLTQVVMLECMLTLKNPKFAEEKEWRLIHQHRGFGVATGANVEYRATPSFVVPYVSLDVSPDHGLRANRIPLARVVVGPTGHPQAAAASARELVADIPGVAVVNSAIPLRT